jgi:membrane protein implicated in regulation of membrane protease activity
MIWTIWWAWMAFGLVLVIVEIIVPGFIFLGFAIGAAVVALMLAFGFVLTLAWSLVVFAAISAVAWVVLRQVFGVRKGQLKTFEHDINED